MVCPKNLDLPTLNYGHDQWGKGSQKTLKPSQRGFFTISFSGPVLDIFLSSMIVSLSSLLND
jgi:hypothetical protein